ncbi:MAG: Calcium-transporting ATPase, partial [Candidatus Moranbacteria bacterium GW2011_GWD2_38_7]
EQLIAKISEKEIVFARIEPEQKLRIATALKNSGAVIAMTGDGVNDAPALKKADIGIAMGITGTDVSKEASDLILLDDNFASIVKVVRQGRTIYQNLKKFVYYVFTSNVSEFFTVAIGLLLQIPAPIAAVQILAIDLGTDIFPSFSLSMEKSEPGVMKRKPFSSNDKIINAATIWRLVRVGLIMATGAVITFILSMKRGGWDFGNKIDTNSVLYIRSTSATYAVLAMSQMANLLAARSETLSVFTLGFFKNRYAIGAIAISTSILLSFMYVPLLQNYLRMMPITWRDWVAVAIVTLAVFVFEEGRKAENRKQ